MLGVREDGLSGAERGLFGSIAVGDVEGVARAAREGARLDAKNHHGHTPWMSAAWHGQADCLEALAKLGAPDGVDAHGRAARMLACVGRKAAKDKGASREDLDGRWSARLAKMLVEADPQSRRDDNGGTALMEACLVDWVEGAAAYLERDDPLATTHWSDTALMHAAYGGSESCARLLLPLSKAWVENRHDETAASLARSQGRHKLAEWLEEAAKAQLERLALERAAKAAPATGPKTRM